MGVITATEAEACCLHAGDYPLGVPVALSEHISVVVSGIGAAPAEQAARMMIESGHRALVSTGTAVALSETLKAGDLTLPRELVHTDGTCMDLDSAWRSRMKRRLAVRFKLEEGRYGEADVILSDGQQKLGFARTHNLVAADMESAAIARVAVDSSIPFVVCRVIVDSVSMIVPESVIRATDESGCIDLFALAGSLIRRPRELAPFLSLGLAFRKSRRTLRYCSLLLAPDFAFS